MSKRSPRGFAILRLPDLAVFLLVTAITVFCAVGVYGKAASTVRFVIQGKKGTWIYPVNQTVCLDAEGPLGTTVIELRDGSAQVVSSPCTNQICVTSGAIHRRGQWIACLPNAVFVRVEAQGGNEAERTELDGTTW